MFPTITLVWSKITTKKEYCGAHHVISVKNVNKKRPPDWDFCRFVTWLEGGRVPNQLHGSVTPLDFRLPSLVSLSVAGAAKCPFACVTPWLLYGLPVNNIQLGYSPPRYLAKYTKLSNFFAKKLFKVLIILIKISSC